MPNATDATTIPTASPDTTAGQTNAFFLLIKLTYSRNFLPELAGISRRRMSNRRSSHPDWAAATHRSPGNRRRIGMH